MYGRVVFLCVLPLMALRARLAYLRHWAFRWLIALRAVMGGVERSGVLLVFMIGFCA